MQGARMSGCWCEVDVVLPRGGCARHRVTPVCVGNSHDMSGGDSVCGGDSFAVFQPHPHARPGSTKEFVAVKRVIQENNVESKYQI